MPKAGWSFIAFGSWERARDAVSAARYGQGLTIIRSDQCPYHPDAARILLEAAAKKKIKTRVVEFRTARDVQTLSPSPFGVFNIIYKGKLLGYHYMQEDDFIEACGRSS